LHKFQRPIEPILIADFALRFPLGSPYIHTKKLNTKTNKKGRITEL